MSKSKAEAILNIPELNISVADANDYSIQSSEILDKFCEELYGDDNNYQIDEQNERFIWSKGASQLIDNKIAELLNIGRLYFDEKDLNVWSLWYQDLTDL